MRRLLITLFACAAMALALTACSGQSQTSSNSAPSAAEHPPAGGQGTLTVQATQGAEKFPVSGLAVGVTACQAGSAPTTMTTAGREGAATQPLPSGCYQVAASGVPSGCELGSPSPVQVDVAPSKPATATFTLKCA